MGILITCIGQKHAIIVGLALEACQLALLGFFSAPWILWTAGSIAGLGSITYPALSAFLSNHGLLTGIRGLCGGLGPAVYGLIFFIFQVSFMALLSFLFICFLSQYSRIFHHGRRSKSRD
ncbi:unnamed protein product [Hymenolepis diminuta]|uniref:MFS domain-containing protein n=1 Tax=Hymenolepis diminuta TaxID=6216 RepID=A0A0R3SDT6_HYMDI|nr:unnamed protein product [Hymenolepis diminuta]